MNQQEIAERNTLELETFFQKLLVNENEEGDLGVTSFQIVYNELMPVQKEKIREITGDQFSLLYESGSIICIGVSYRDPVIDFIDEKQNGNPDYKLWNDYAKEYNRINQVLNRMAGSIAARFDGIPLKATIGGDIGYINHVSEYSPMVISHRV
ncbi:MAG: hypothetical protein ACXABE_15475, partial [Candidatus Thorarchaeota archaeon]